MSTAVADAPTTTRIARSELAAALKLAASIRAPSLHLDLGECHASAYTREVGVRVKLDMPAGAGAVIVPRVALAKLVACCGPTLDIAVDDSRLVITSGPGTFTLPGTPEAVAAGLHAFAEPSASVMTIEAPVLTEALRRVLPHVSGDYTRPILCTAALYRAQHTIVGTDSYRLARVRFGDPDPHSDGETPILLGRSGALSMQHTLAKRLGQVEVWQASTVRARFEGIDWSLRTQDGVFPSYTKLLPDAADFTATLKVDRDDLLAGVRSALAVVQGQEPMQLVLEADSCSVRCGLRSEYGKVERRLESATFDGPALTVGFNAVFLGDVVKSPPVETLTFRFTSPLRQTVLEAARDLYILMPIRLHV
jgi:DNA polymerase III sliding clamp (beta) subunit (PCNA family)